MGVDKAKEHSAFLAEFAAELGYFFEMASSDIDRMSEFIEWFAEKVFSHGYGHGVEDAENGSPVAVLLKDGDRVTDYKYYTEKGWISDDLTKDGLPRGDEDVERMYSSDGWYTGEEAGP